MLIGHAKNENRYSPCYDIGAHDIGIVNSYKEFYFRMSYNKHGVSMKLEREGGWVEWIYLSSAQRLERRK